MFLKVFYYVCISLLTTLGGLNRLAADEINSDHLTHKNSLTEDTSTELDTRIHWWIIKEFEFAAHAIIGSIVGAEQILNGESASNDTRGLPGAVIAAPSTEVDSHTGELHDYNWTWKRDAAIVMKSVLDLWEHGYFYQQDKELFEIMSNYVDFVRQDQLNTDKGMYGIGDAKVTLYNTPNLNKWGGPQTDGPALQNLTLIKLFNFLASTQNKIMNAHSINQLQSKILEVIITNTLYTLDSYKIPNVDTWEEVKAKSHFSTLIVQRESLLRVIELYKNLKSKRNHFNLQDLKNNLKTINRTQKDIKNKIEKNHLSQKYGYILAHYGVLIDESLMRDKATNLDTQVNLGILQVHTQSSLSEKYNFLSPSSSWLRATVEKQRQSFVNMYSINNNSLNHYGEVIPGYGVGRYIEDRHFGGQIWTLTTLAQIKGYLSDAIESELKEKIVITDLDRNYFLNLETGLSINDLTGTIHKEDYRFEMIINSLMKRAKSIFYRVMDHTGPDDLVLTEIIDKDTGFKRGIQDLTWSYVEFINAYRLLLKAKKMGLSTKHSGRVASKNCHALFVN